MLEVLPPRLGNTLPADGRRASCSLGDRAGLPPASWRRSRPGGLVDYGVNLFAFAGISVPSFWLALLLILLFAVELGWLPASGCSGRRRRPARPAARHLVLPVLTLTLRRPPARSSASCAPPMLETLREDYIRTARAKGVGRAAASCCATRCATPMMPVVTVLALRSARCSPARSIVETVFAWLGMGKLIYDAIMGNDFNLALAGLLLATLATAARAISPPTSPTRGSTRASRSMRD